MFHNLRAEMAREGLNIIAVAKAIKVTPKSAGKKLSGKTEFTLTEIQTIKTKLFPSLSLDYLFDNTEKGGLAWVGRNAAGEGGKCGSTIQVSEG